MRAKNTDNGRFVKTPASGVALEYVKKHSGIMSKSGMARQLSIDHPDLFTSKENARNMVRRHMERMGLTNEPISEDSPRFQHVKKLPSVLLLDIETAPMKVFSWNLFKPILGYDNIDEEWFILSWAAKWLHRPEVYSDVVTPKESVNLDDKRICRSVFDFLEKADIVIGHNVRKFDIRKINSRFLMNGVKRPSPYQTIDTLVESRKNFAHSSHRLDYLGQKLANDEKLYTNYGLWKKCKAGDADSLKYMDEYCQKDILLLEDVYMEMRGWIKSHPNMALYVEADRPICPTCASSQIETCGEYVTMAGAFTSFRCGNCGSIGRLRKSNLTPRERELLTISVAR